MPLTIKEVNCVEQGYYCETTVMLGINLAVSRFQQGVRHNNNIIVHCSTIVCTASGEGKELLLQVQICMSKCTVSQCNFDSVRDRALSTLGKNRFAMLFVPLSIASCRRMTV